MSGVSERFSTVLELSSTYSVLDKILRACFDNELFEINKVEDTNEDEVCDGGEASDDNSGVLDSKELLTNGDEDGMRTLALFGTWYEEYEFKWELL